LIYGLLLTVANQGVKTFNNPRVAFNSVGFFFLGKLTWPPKNGAERGHQIHKEDTMAHIGDAETAPIFIDIQ